MRSPVTFVLGILLFLFGVFLVAAAADVGVVVPLVIGGTLVWLGWRGGRVATLIFGHATVAAGCFLITWGLYLLPTAKPDLAHIFGRPLFWGMIAVGGGVCAIYHGFCRCVRRNDPPCVK